MPFVDEVIVFAGDEHGWDEASIDMADGRYIPLDISTAMSYEHEAFVLNCWKTHDALT